MSHDDPRPDGAAARPFKRRPGRPRELVDPSELTVRMHGELHDRLVQEAARRRIPPGKLARELLDLALQRATH